MRLPRCLRAMRGSLLAPLAERAQKNSEIIFTIFTPSWFGRNSEGFGRFHLHAIFMVWYLSSRLPSASSRLTPSRPRPQRKLRTTCTTYTTYTTADNLHPFERKWWVAYGVGWGVGLVPEGQKTCTAGGHLHHSPELYLSFSSLC